MTRHEAHEGDRDLLVKAEKSHAPFFVRLLYAPTKRHYYRSRVLQSIASGELNAPR